MQNGAPTDITSDVFKREKIVWCWRKKSLL